jgi:hypothetical protein
MEEEEHERGRRRVEATPAEFSAEVGAPVPIDDSRIGKRRFSPSSPEYFDPHYRRRDTKTLRNRTDVTPKKSRAGGTPTGRKALRIDKTLSLGLCRKVQRIVEIPNASRGDGL